ncbi:MAG: hypothetical protein JWN04_840 [Myxococcaceae bacterium]|nr:hypothetical protein [Myxococcaceae bacterium]
MRASKCRPPRQLPWLFFCALLLSSLLLTPSVQAIPVKPKTRSQISLEEVAVMLSSSSEDEVRTALETAATLPARDIVAMLDERVRSGLSRELLDVAIDSLLLLDDKTASPLLVDLAQHRRPEVRVRALEVMGRLKSSNLESVLLRGLSDVTPEVRKAAADALAESGARGSIPTLFKAFERGVEPAGVALGRLAKPEDLTRLLDYVGKLALDTVTPMVVALLGRRDLSEADKLRALNKVTTLAGDDATSGAETLLAQLPSDASPRLRRALTDAVEKGKAP